MPDDTQADPAPEPRAPRRNSAFRPLYVLLRNALITLAIAAILAGSLSRWMWGYWFSRPGVDARALSASALVSVTPVTPERRPDGSWELIPAAAPLGLGGWEASRYTGPGWYQHTLFANESDYYLLDLRLLRSLEQSGVASKPVPPLNAKELAGIMRLVEQSGEVATESSGYHQWHPAVWPYSGGVVYELIGANGQPLLFVALRGGEVSNDHHSYYELLFAPQSTGPPRVVSAKRFFFDVAGFEGAEFPGFFRGFAIIGLIAVIPATLLVILVAWVQRSVRTRRGHCPACNYDLTGNTTNLCPECGRPTPAAPASSAQGGAGGGGA